MQFRLLIVYDNNSKQFTANKSLDVKKVSNGEEKTWETAYKIHRWKTQGVL